jgi:uncharacterized protein
MVASPSLITRLAAASPPVLRAVLQLNERNETELSRLDEARLGELIAQAFHAAAIGDGVAFLLAFDQHAAYDSPNFRWFQSRYPRFVYVDRVAVANSARGRGLASFLYRDLFKAALGAGHSTIACEVNIDPPNPASDRFHEAHGFTEVGQARLGNGKTVRYLVKRLSANS